MSTPAEHYCPHCADEVLVRREPIFEGFRKVSERLLCSLCGHEFADTEEPARRTAKPAPFGTDELPAPPRVFDESERGKSCRHCRHYVVNPFRQWCGRHLREIEATDLCDDFARPDAPHPTP